jgi:RNA polymerase sigma-32 factor
MCRTRFCRANPERRCASTTWFLNLEAASVSRSASPSILGQDSGFKRYVGDVNRVPLLEPEEEFLLAKRYREHGDRAAADRLVKSHLRLVVKLAANYRGYGLPVAELISEGNIGLMQAIERFEPDKGFRLATYAAWWIKAAIQQYIIRSTSLVKMGTTASQRKLFFNLRKAKSRISALDEGDMRPDQVELIAKRLNVTEQDVIDMNRRLSGDISLSTPMGEESDSASWQDLLADGAPNQEELLAKSGELADGRAALAEALTSLTERERRIFVSRRLVEQPRKLEEIASEYGVSRERVRQIEMAAFEKVRRFVKRTAASAQTAEPLAA